MNWGMIMWMDVHTNRVRMDRRIEGNKIEKNLNSLVSTNAELSVFSFLN